MKNPYVRHVAPTKSLSFEIFGSESVCPARNDIGAHFFNYNKVIKTIVSWLGAFEKVCIYIVILFEVDFKATIVM